MLPKTCISFSGFQLTRSVGSVTTVVNYFKILLHISTHTLRGERDVEHKKLKYGLSDFNSPAPWGA